MHCAHFWSAFIRKGGDTDDAPRCLELIALLVCEDKRKVPNLAVARSGPDERRDQPDWLVDPEKRAGTELDRARRLCASLVRLSLHLG